MGLSDNYHLLCAALGKFVNEFGKTESFLYERLRRESGLDRDTATAIFDKPTFSAMKNIIRKLIKLNGSEQDQYFDKAIMQLGNINTLRNDIVHCNVGMFATELTYTVFNDGRRNHKNAEYVISIDDINAASADLRLISMMLIRIFTQKDYAATGAPDPWDYLISSTWSYKSL